MRNHPSPGVSACVAAASLLIMAVLPQPAAAKSLFESIFGFLQSPPQPGVGGRPKPTELPRNNPFEGAYPYPALSYSNGRYRTVCVRLCDGYFFPVSNTSSHRDFHRDAQRCQSSCQANTRLYYMPSSNPAIELARDQRGLPYSDLKTAFLYRKKYSKSCTCRPPPWSVSERMRHRSYLPGSENRTARLAALAEQGRSDRELTARPELIDRRNNAFASSPFAIPEPPTPSVAWQAASDRRRPPRVRRQPSNNSGWGLANSLPKVRYRHDWSTD